MMKWMKTLLAFLVFVALAPPLLAAGCDGQVCAQPCDGNGGSCGPIDCYFEVNGECNCTTEIKDRPWGQIRICRTSGGPCAFGCGDDGIPSKVLDPGQEPKNLRRDQMERELAAIAREEGEEPGAVSEFVRTASMVEAIRGDRDLTEALDALVEDDPRSRLFVGKSRSIWIAYSPDRKRWSKAINANVSSWRESADVMAVRIEFDGGRIVTGTIWERGAHGHFDDENGQRFSW